MIFFYLLLNECDEAARPVATADGAQVGIRSQQVLHNKAVSIPVYTVTALNMVSEATFRRKVLQAGIVKFMRTNQRLPFTFARLRPPRCALPACVGGSGSEGGLDSGRFL